eukprot:937082_1
MYHRRRTTETSSSSSSVFSTHSVSAMLSNCFLLSRVIVSIARIVALLLSFNLANVVAPLSSASAASKSVVSNRNICGELSSFSCLLFFLKCYNTCLWLCSAEHIPS